MSNDLTLSKTTISPSSPSFSPSILQQGQKNTLIQNANTVIINGSPIAIPTIMPTQPLNPNTDYYNLIVGDMVSFDRSDIILKIEPEKALTEYINHDIKNQFATLSNEAIQTLKSFPTIFMQENKEYGRATPEQQAGFGYIQDVEIRRKGIIIKTSILSRFTQQILNDHRIIFDIYGHEDFTELNQGHWTIKKVNLISKLRELGLQI